MIREGKPFIPPLCPTYRAGGKFDIDPAKFVLYVAEVEDDESGKPTEFEIEGAFYSTFFAEELTETPAVVATSFVSEPIDSPLATSARYLHPGIHTAVHPGLGKIFCERIMNCRGIRKDGECWALGKQGVKDAVAEYESKIPD